MPCFLIPTQISQNCTRATDIDIVVGSACKEAARSSDALGSDSRAQFEMRGKLENHNPFGRGPISGCFNIWANIKFAKPSIIAVQSLMASMEDLASPGVGQHTGCVLLQHARVEEEVTFIGRRADGAPERQLWLIRTTGAGEDWRHGISTRFELFRRKPEPENAIGPICMALLCYSNVPGEGLYEHTQPTLKWIAVRGKYKGKGYACFMMLEIERFLKQAWTLAWPDFLIWDAAGESIAPFPNACHRYPAQAFFDAMGFEFEPLLQEEAKRVVYLRDAFTEIVSRRHGALFQKCAICVSLMRPGDRIIRLNCDSKCAHFFHARCLAPVLRDKGLCPVCRHEISGWSSARKMLKYALKDELP